MARARAPRSSSRYVALVRGVNVGGRGLIAMADLATLFEQAGCADVRTYIASGNVAFTASPALAERIPATISSAIAFQPRIMVRTATELARVARGNPFPAAAPGTLHVAFLADKPLAAAVATLDPDHGKPEAFRVDGREIYLYLPHGAGKAKLTSPYFERRLATLATVRNWNTLLALCELARS